MLEAVFKEKKAFFEAETARLKQSESDLVEKLKQAGTGTGGTNNGTDHARSPPSSLNPSPPNPQLSTPASTKRGIQTPTATTRGVASSLAASLVGLGGSMSFRCF